VAAARRHEADDQTDTARWNKIIRDAAIEPQ